MARFYEQLPPQHSASVKAIYAKYGFSNYDAVTDEIETYLKEHGFEHKVRARSTVALYGPTLKEQFDKELFRLKALRELSEVAVRSNRDDSGAINEMMLSMTQGVQYQLLLDISDAGLDVSALDNESRLKFLDKLTKRIQEIGDASVRQKAFRIKVEEKLIALESEAKAGKSGLDMETLKRVRQELYGL
jgi:hypothetical protein